LEINENGLPYLRMKNTVYILIFLTNLTLGQTVKLTELEIEKYARSIDKLRTEDKLVKISCPNMSRCGGGLDGYYFNKKLVLLDATYGAELGFSSKTFYIDQDKFLKVIYRECFAEWEKYGQNYPTDKFEFDETKMTYSDTVYSIILANPTVFHKKANNKIITNKIDQSLLEMLVNCGQEMKLELQEVIKQVDSLRFVKEMPYICGPGICGDNLYWEAVGLRDSGIELLIDKLDDTTSTTANVVLFGGNYTVADIAYNAITEIIHDVPTFELLGVPLDKEGCCYCSYWQHLNKDFSNRQKFKEAVGNWYHKNKDSLVWVKSNDFATCDCRGVSTPETRTVYKCTNFVT
jgi:hypothetical protein